MSGIWCGCRKWLADPRPEALPDSSGLWEDVFTAFYRLLRRQRRSESRLTATLQEFRQAGMAMPDGLVIVDGSQSHRVVQPESASCISVSTRSAMSASWSPTWCASRSSSKASTPAAIPNR